MIRYVDVHLKRLSIMNGKRPNRIIRIESRRGVTNEDVSAAIESALCDAEIGIDDVRIFASSRLKENEAGIKEAVRSLGREIVFMDDETINTYEPSVAGFASPHIEPRLHHAGLVGETQELVMHEELQSRGIGAELVLILEDEAEKRGCDFIEVTTRETRVDTQRFYEHRGFLATYVSFTKV